jgi:hypothetical protein
VKLAAALVVLAAAASAFAQQKPSNLPKADPVTFDALEVKQAELPKDVAIVDGLHFASQAPRVLLEGRALADFVPEKDREDVRALEASAPKAVRRAAQSFRGADGFPVTAVRLEYDADAAPWTDFLHAFLWGPRDHAPTMQRPDELWISGKVVLVLSAPRGAAGAEWFKGRLRKKFGLPAHRWTPELDQFRRRMQPFVEHDMTESGLVLLDASSELIADDATAHLWRGELASVKEDWNQAARGFRAALYLHDEREDPLEPALLWRTTQGLGTTLLFQRKLDEAAAMLRRAADAGRASRTFGWSQSLYSLACAEAARRRAPESIAALKDAIAADPKWRDEAKTDASFASLRDTAEFKALMAR